MATILLGVAGAAIGGAVGGSVLGLSSVIIGRAIGATLGRVIDQRLMGAGSDVVELGKLSRYRVTGASEGTPMGRVYARTRIGGQVVWSTRFKEKVSKKKVGGKGGGGGATAKTYSYSVSMAVALGEGPILRVGRVWADGMEIDTSQLDMRVYHGTEDQQPDPLIEAVEGAGTVPAYRGTAYVVIENMPLGDYGNRVPQLSFEVVRLPDPEVVPEGAESLATLVQGMALIPGSGEYVLDTERAEFTDGPGRTKVVNLNAYGSTTDFLVSMRQLQEEVPTCTSVVLVVCWFGTDLRCGECDVHPRVEQTEADSTTVPWYVSGLVRADAEVVPMQEGRPVYGGTPTDQSVVAAIKELRARGLHVTFYPFLLMEQMGDNTLTDPWTGQVGQPALPWRGRITTSFAPGQAGSTDGTAQAEGEVDTFFGHADAGQFTKVLYPLPTGSEDEDAPELPDARPVVSYAGSTDWGYRRFILHYATLCAAAGGVDAFCVGSELRSLTQIRGAANAFPAVEALRVLAGDVRGVLGNDAKIGYAADWSEYFGYQPQDGSGDVFFHLDPLWSDASVDFIGIDNYMPLSDWREGLDHLDALDGVSSIYDIDYLKSGVAGGEGYNWYYASDTDRAAQVRSPIFDGAHGEDWIYRYKDLRGWWENPHHERVGGVRSATPTVWVPQSKPIWFTEFGCAAVDKATNQPNKFIDPKSSESQLPYHSNGARDELIQGQYLRAVLGYWAEAANNPVSSVYGGPMVDLSKAHVWAWDTRPYPAFPTRMDLWTDGENYALGHWLNGRTSHEALAAVIADVCNRSGLSAVDVAQTYGLVRGYEGDLSAGARGALQPLLLGYGVNAAEREGTLRFTMRTGRADASVDREDLARHQELTSDIERARSPAAESPGRVRLGYIRALSGFETAATEAAFPGDEARTPATSELALVLSEGEATATAERWLAEGRVARDALRLALPPSSIDLGAGDVLSVEGEGLFRVDRVELGAGQLIDAVRVEPGAYVSATIVEDSVTVRPPSPPVPVEPVFMDLPLLSDGHVAHAPYLSVAAEPWPGPVATYASATDAGYALNHISDVPGLLGLTLDPLPAAAPGRWDRGAPLRVQIYSGGPLASVEREALLSGGNAFAIGDGSTGTWEVFQAEVATLVAEDVYALSLRLRGQLGTDALMPADWPVGSRVVLLDESVAQIDMALSDRGLARHYRVGPSGLTIDDPAMRHFVLAFEGVGLRPYAPVHLRVENRADGGLDLSWIRRTRIGGDSWLGEDAPLGEDSEAYRVHVLGSDGAVLRTADVTVPRWTWTAAERAEDSGAVAIEVAQISQAYGAGPYRRIMIDD
ncbi:MAG: glycoside hydrolase/phage tail family protein [Pseudomonadota bacterium]